MKTATKQRNILLMLMSMFWFLACTFGDPTYDHDPLPTLTSTESGGAKFNLSQGGSGSTDCPCSIVSIQGYKPRAGFTVYKNVLGLKPGEFCVCSPTGGTTGTTTSTNVAGNGSTQDPPPATGGTTWTDYPSYGGDSSTGGTSAVGGDGSTLDPPPTGGTGNTQDPPVGGNGNTQDPPPAGGTSAVGGASSATGGKGNTQDPPGGSAGIAGMTGAGGGSTQDPPVGGKSSTGGTSATGGAKSTGGSSATGGTKSTGGSPSTGGATVSTGGITSTGGNTGTGGSSNCTKQSYKFYVTAAQESLGSGTVTCTNLTTKVTLKPTECSDASCCYYDIPNSCDRWACHQINKSKGMPRIPSYDTQAQKGILDWGAASVITTLDHYWLLEGIDYNIVCDANHLCDLVLEPHAGEHFYL